MKYVRVYHMLVCHGHAPDKAVSIIIDAKRGDPWSLRWIRRARNMIAVDIWADRKRIAARRQQEAA